MSGYKELFVVIIIRHNEFQQDGRFSWLLFIIIYYFIISINNTPPTTTTYLKKKKSKF